MAIDINNVIRPGSNPELVNPTDTLEERVFKQTDRWEEIGKIQLHPDTKALLVEWQDAKELLTKRPNRSAAFNHFLCILEDTIREEIQELKDLKTALDKHQK